MKIFIVCNSLGKGGAERVGVNLANGFSKHGHDVCIITDTTQDVAYSIDSKIEILSYSNPLKNKIVKYLSTIWNIRKYAKKNKPDVVIGMMHLASFLPLMALLGLHIPVVLTIHHALSSVGNIYSLKTRIIDRITPFLYSHTTVLTKIDYDILYKYSHKISIMPNPLSFDPVKNIPTKEKVILAAGRIDAWNYKGFDILMQAWNKISSLYPDWTLIIAGQGREQSIDFLKSYLTSVDAKRQTQFIGYSKNMITQYKRSSIFVLSSRSEGLPMVLIEAMSQGCAPLATANMGRTAEIITTDSEGLICKSEDVNDLANKLSMLISDDKKRIDILKEAVLRSKYYSQDNIIRKWEKLLFDLLKKNK